jgi:hypothetical protein
MKLAYLIAAHHQPAHFQRLLDALLTASSAAFVHIDAKSPIAPFLGTQHSNVHFCKPRVPVYWGEYSQVDATMIMLREALASPSKFDYFVLLSGADYPLRPAAAIEAFFARHSGTEFINLVRMPNERASKPVTRLTQYKVLSGRFTTLPEKALRRLLIRARLLPAERDYTAALAGFIPCGGSSWWALSRSACEYIVAITQSMPRLVDFFRHTWFPDETYFQTLLGNSPFRDRIRRNLTYADWHAGGAHPAQIEARHLQSFADCKAVPSDVYGAGELLFARKFRDADAALTAQIDALMTSTPSLNPRAMTA